MSATLWMITTIAAAAGMLVCYLLLKKPLKALDQVSKGYQPPQIRFRYAQKDIFADLDAQGRRMLQRFSLLFVPTLFFASLCMAAVAHNAAEAAWMRHTMYALTVCGCLTGFVETLLIAGGRGVKAAPVCSLIKWACFAVWTVGMFAGLIIRGWAMQ